MGSTYRGIKRDTSMRNRRAQVSNLLISALKVQSTATFSPKQIITSKFSNYPTSLIIQYLMMLFPHFAPLIFAAYLAYKSIQTIIFAAKEYNELKRNLSIQEALIVESKRFVIREGLRYILDEYLVKTIRDTINNSVATLVTSKPIQKLISTIIDKDEHKQERLQYFIAVTISQFIDGALTGRTTDDLVKEAAKILIEE